MIFFTKRRSLTSRGALLNLFQIDSHEMVQIRPKQFRPIWLARPCSELLKYWTDFHELCTIRRALVWNGAVLDFFRLDQHKWTKLVQNHQKSWLARPCSETTEPISMIYAPFDASWSETVPFWVLFRLGLYRVFHNYRYKSFCIISAH